MEFPIEYRATLLRIQDDPAEEVAQLLTYFCKFRAEEENKESARCMRTVPRQYERAADHAAKAEVYEGFVRDLLSSK